MIGLAELSRRNLDFLLNLIISVRTLSVFHKVMVTRVEVQLGERKVTAETQANFECFHSSFEFSQTFTGTSFTRSSWFYLYHNFMELPRKEISIKLFYVK